MSIPFNVATVVPFADLAEYRHSVGPPYLSMTAIAATKSMLTHPALVLTHPTDTRLTGVCAPLCWSGVCKAIVQRRQ
jgi:hypothetical protein